MILTLEVIGPQAAALGAQSRRVFSGQGGVIGRAKNSDWILPHVEVSNRHAVISYADGAYYIEDTSMNGVFLNSRHNRLVAGRRYALQSGDHIFIDPYEIGASFSGHHEVVPNPFDSEDPVAAAPYRHAPPITPARGSLTPEPAPLEEVDPLKLIGSGPKRTPARDAPSAEGLHHRSILSDHYQPPAVVPSSPVPTEPEPFTIPADYDIERDDFVRPPVPPFAPPATPAPERPRTPVSTAPPHAMPSHVPEPVPRASAPGPSSGSVTQPEDAEAKPAQTLAAEGTAGLLALLEGAGLHDTPPSIELARSFGEILRAVVSGVIDLLRSRQHVKDEFRMRVTIFRPGPAENNPLKFSANVDDALHNLLVKRNPAYLGPVQSFEDAFDDLRNHQLAVLAGMRVAFESMLAQFDPDRLEKQFDRQLKRVPFLRLIAGLRYWDLYRDRLDEIAKDPDASFRRLFGEEFARTYEEQLNRLKADSRAGAAENNTGIQSSAQR